MAPDDQPLEDSATRRHHDETAGPRVLIIDDDERMLLIFAKILEQEGYVVRVATTALSGLDEARQDPPDAILLDFRMPCVNGLGFLYRLRSLPMMRTTPVAVITGDVGLKHEEWSQIEDLGAEVWFKPLRRDDLLLATKLLFAKRPRLASLTDHAGIRA